MSLKMRALVIVLGLVVAFDFLTVYVHGCGNKPISVAVNITDAQGNTVVRCIFNNKASCPLSCNSAIGEVQTPAGVKFPNTSICLSYQGFFICAKSLKDPSTYSCESDLTGCPAGTTKLTADNYVSTTACSTALAVSSSYILCYAASTFLYTCELALFGCSQPATKFATTTYDTIDSCLKSIPVSIQRCLAVPFVSTNVVNPAATQCVTGQPVASVCPSNMMIQPVTGQFQNGQSCQTYTGFVRCYDKRSNSYNCQSDLTGCIQPAIQLSNSMVQSDCDLYYAITYVRCATTSGVICRPGEYVTWANSNSKIIVPTPVDKVQDACFPEETPLPLTLMILKPTCDNYGGKVVCYTYSTLRQECVDDFVCMGADKKALTTVNPSTCLTYTPSAYIRCSDECRPKEAGCASGETLVQGALFATTDQCYNYLATGKYVRCLTRPSTLYCSFEVCKLGDTYLDTQTFDNSDACNANIYITRICYIGLSGPTGQNGDYYNIEFANDFDNGGNCVQGLQLSQWMKSKTAPTQQSAIDFYKAMTLQHYRCVVGTIPICRPDLDPSTPATQDCLVGEAKLNSQNYQNLGACNNELYWGKSCYHPTTDSTSATPYYTVIAYYDFNFITGCPSTDYEASGWQRGSGLNAISIAGTYGEFVAMKHIRCSQASVTTICRPEFSGTGTYAAGNANSGCPSSTSETKLSPSTGFATLNDCKQLVASSLVCYTGSATLVSGKYYTLTLDSTGTSCAGGVTFGVPVSAGSTSAQLDAAYPAWLVNHYRCTNGGAAVCRPDMDPSTPAGDCFGTETLLTNPGTPYATLSACMNELYYAVPCYQATAGPGYYTIEAGLETTTPPYSCGANQVKLSSTIYKGSDPTDIKNKVGAFYTPSASIDHYRCNDAGTVVCRPDMVIGNGPIDCFSAEVYLSTTATGVTLPFTTKTNCEQAMFGVPCYRGQAATPYYSIVAGLDTTLPTAGTCPTATDIKLSATFYYATSSGALDTAVAAFYTDATALFHYRCKTGDNTPFCRPDMVPSTPATIQCFGTEALAAATAATPKKYNTRGDCKIELYQGKACYLPKQTAPYYTISGGLDTQATPGTCPTNAIQLTALTSYYVGTDQTTLDAACKTAYEATAMTHLRCDIGTLPVCRPQQCFTSVIAGLITTAETQLTTTTTNGPTFTSLSDCTAKRYFSLMCYNPSLTPDPSVYDCVSDALGCTAPYQYLNKPFGGAVDQTTADTGCQGDTSSMWIRCAATAGNAASANCRPTSVGCTPSETRLYPSGSLQTRATCRSTTQYIACYDPAVTNILSITCPADYVLCPSQLRYPITTATVDTVTAANTPCPNPTPVIFYRCKQSNGNVVCRPDMLLGNGLAECYTGETAMTTLSTTVTVFRFTTFQSCLDNIFYGKVCYTPTQTAEPFYTITGSSSDAAVSNPGTCTSPAILLTGLTSYYSGSSQAAVDAACKAAYEASTINHRRCDIGAIPVCRPQCFTSVIAGVITTAEVDLATTATSSPPFAGLTACNNNRYFSLMCHNTAVSDSTATKCQSDALGCAALTPNGYTYASKSYGGASAQATADSSCSGDANIVRCAATAGGAASAACRSNSPGCGGSETRLYNSGSLISLTTCATTAAWIRCYDTSSTTNDMASALVWQCPADYALCAGSDVKYPSTSTVNTIIQPQPNAATCAQSPTTFIRCERNANPRYVICRPLTSCPSGESRRNFGTTYNSVNNCLNDNNSYCRCNAGTTCRQKGTSLTNCCNGNNVQLPDDYTFYVTSGCT